MSGKPYHSLQKCCSIAALDLTVFQTCSLFNSLKYIYKWVYERNGCVNVQMDKKDERAIVHDVISHHLIVIYIISNEVMSWHLQNYICMVNHMQLWDRHFIWNENRMLISKQSYELRPLGKVHIWQYGFYWNTMMLLWDNFLVHALHILVLTRMRLLWTFANQEFMWSEKLFQEYTQSIRKSVNVFINTM